MTADLHLAIVVNPALPIGLLANTVGAIAIGIGAWSPELGDRGLTDAAGRSIAISCDRPVPILQAEASVLSGLLIKTIETVGAEGAVVPFPAYARALHDYADYERAFPTRDLSQEAIDGLGLVGPSKWVRSLTGALRLLR